MKKQTTLFWVFSDSRLEGYFLLENDIWAFNFQACSCPRFINVWSFVFNALLQSLLKIKASGTSTCTSEGEKYDHDLNLGVVQERSSWRNRATACSMDGVERRPTRHNELYRINLQIQNFQSPGTYTQALLYWENRNILPHLSPITRYFIVQIFLTVWKKFALRSKL